VLNLTKNKSAVLEDISDRQLASTLIDVEILLTRATNKHPMAVFVALEKRLFKTAMRAFLIRADDGVHRAVNRVQAGSGAVPTRSDLRAVKSVLRDSFKGFAQEMRPMVGEVIRRSYIEGQKMSQAKIKGHMRGKMMNLRPRLSTTDVFKAREDEAAAAAAAAAARRAAGLIDEGSDFAEAADRASYTVSTAFDVEDQAAIRAMTRHQLFWTGNNYEENLSERIAQVCEETMLRQGLGRDQAADALRKALVAEFDLEPEAPFVRGPITIPSGWKGTVTQYFEGLSANATTTARIAGSLQEFKRAAVTHYEWINPEDDRTCDVCAWMDGKVFAVDESVDQMNRMVNAKSPTDIKEIHKWDHLGAILRKTGMTKSMSGRVSAGHSLNLQTEGYGLPPIHFSCRCTIDIAEDAIIGDIDYNEYQIGEGE
jgi:SPP1 gp7 family putative phage head morphogenesis protein